MNEKYVASYMMYMYTYKKGNAIYHIGKDLLACFDFDNYRMFLKVWRKGKEYSIDDSRYYLNIMDSVAMGYIFSNIENNQKELPYLRYKDFRTMKRRVEEVDCLLKLFEEGNAYYKDINVLTNLS